MNNSKSGDFVSGLQEAIRQNPVSAALVGMGVLWMFAGGNRITAAAALLPSAAGAAATGVATGLKSSADAFGAVTEGMRSAGSRIVDGVRDTVSDATASASESASQAYDAAKSVVSDATAKVNQSANTQATTGPGMAGVLQNNLKQTFERQPLLLGAIGLAVGAGMAAGLPPTKIETEFAGDTADRVTEQVKDFASEQMDRVSETAKRTFEAVKDEAATQGLTPQAAKDGATALGDCLDLLAKAARRKTS